MGPLEHAVREREAEALHAREAAEDRGAVGQRVRFNARFRQAPPEEGRVTIQFLDPNDWTLGLLNQTYHQWKETRGSVPSQLAR